MAQRPLFYTYILTNWNRTILYTGFTNNLQRRLIEHWIGRAGSFTTKYKVHYLVWYEASHYVTNAIESENRIKGLSREQKEDLIRETNPEFKFLNEDVIGDWPPTEEQKVLINSIPKDI